MTEFEAATIAFQEATLAFQQATLAVQQGNLALQESQLWASFTIPAATLLVGAGQCVLIWIGLRRMDQANRVRLAEAEAQAAREDARHTEAMTALRAVVQGLERQGAALEAALKGRA